MNGFTSMSVYGYVRVSTLAQAEDGESLLVQQRQLEGYAIMHDLKIDEIVVEEGVSGSVPVDQRSQGKLLFAKLQPGDIILVAKLDRLFRSALDALQTVEKLKAIGVKLHLLDLGGDIAGNGLSKLFLTVAAAFAEAERDRIRERIGQVKSDQRQRGRYLGGIRPFGYRIVKEDDEDGGELVEDVAEQSAIAKIRAMREAGLALRVIAEQITVDGFALSHAGVKKILNR